VSWRDQLRYAPGNDSRRGWRIVVATGFDCTTRQSGRIRRGKIPDVLDGLQFERLCLPREQPAAIFLRRPIIRCQECGLHPVRRIARSGETLRLLFQDLLHVHASSSALPPSRAEGRATSSISTYALVARLRRIRSAHMEATNALSCVAPVSKLYRQGDVVKVMGTDTLTGQNVEIDADMVVLALAMVPSKGTEEIAKVLKIGRDKDGFPGRGSPKLRPVESVTTAVSTRGRCTDPKDIPETVSRQALQLQGIALLSQATSASAVDCKGAASHCTGCGMCVDACPFPGNTPGSGKAVVNEALCEGCGSCSATCLRAAIDVKNVTQLQIFEMIEACWHEKKYRIEIRKTDVGT